MVLEDPVEGFFVKTVDNLIFEVKGVVHPENRIIAYLRYVPSPESSTGFRKVYNLEEREEYLRAKYSDYLWYSESYGRVIQSVPESKTASILSPIECLAHLRHADDITSLEHESIALANILVEMTGIKWTDIGLTGSQLVGVAGIDSDIDLVVYGENVCRGFYSGIRAKIRDIPKIKGYSGKLLEDHVTFRWGDQTDLRPLLLEIERNKLLQGMINAKHFFIRMVKTPHDLDYTFSDLSYEMLGYQKISGRVLDSSDAIFTPCEYQVECMNNPDLAKLTSYRGRFTEQVSVGDQFEALGRLELVTDHREGRQYTQLVLGERPIDYLVPV
ncbi:MAG: hypothetical protein ACFFCP_01780 [Promethearchaeota archaeon]